MEFCTGNTRQNIRNKIEKSSKIGPGKKSFDIDFGVFFDCFCQSLFHYYFFLSFFIVDKQNIYIIISVSIIISIVIIML